MKKKLYKTVIQIEVLSEEPIPDGMSIEEIANEAMDGGYSMVSGIKSSKVIEGKRAANAAHAQGSDPDFFGMDENGNEIDE
jgi:hypothetical protein